MNKKISISYIAYVREETDNKIFNSTGSTFKSLRDGFMFMKSLKFI